MTRALDSGRLADEDAILLTEMDTKREFRIRRRGSLFQGEKADSFADLLASQISRAIASDMR